MMKNKTPTAELEERRIKRREALIAFFKLNEKALRSVNRWAVESQVGERTLGQLIDGSRPKDMRLDTIEKLCAGAGKLLGRPVCAFELTGEQAPSNQVSARSERFLAAFEQLPPEVQDTLISQVEATLKALLR